MKLTLMTAERRALIGVLGALAVPQFALAATVTVNSVRDASDANPYDGVCSTGRLVNMVPECTLRAAIEQSRAAANQVTLPAGTYVLTLGGLEIKDNLVLKGADPRTTIIDGGHKTQVLTVLNTGTNPTVTIDSVTITNGSTSGSGAGIFNNALQANLPQTRFYRSSLTLLNCVVTKNEATLWGSGIYNAGYLQIVESTISDNKNTGDTRGGGLTATGGGIFNANLGMLTVTRSTVSGNQATRGGGIANQVGQVLINNSTISSNRAFGGGGGIHNWAGVVTITFSTITNNVAGFGEGAPDEPADRRTGGGILNFGGSLDNVWHGATVQIGNSILAGNVDRLHDSTHPQFSPDCFSADASSTVLSSGGNLVVGTRKNCNWVRDPNSPSANFDRIGDPRFQLDFAGLPLLADNGGPTKTHALQRNSPAVDGALPNPGYFACPTTDQRGFARGTLPRTCDIGAFEF